MIEYQLTKFRTLYPVIKKLSLEKNCLQNARNTQLKATASLPAGRQVRLGL